MLGQPDTRLPQPAAFRWGRALVASAGVLAVLAVLGGVWRAGRSTPSYARGPGSVVFRGTDYAFSPSRITWRVGERVTLTFENDSDGRPGKPHELMFGRRPVEERTLFGMTYPGGYETDFFEGVDVRLGYVRNLGMLMPGDALVSGRMPPMDMGGMAMGAGGGENGFMLLVRPGGTATISFVVPNKPGRWEYGCFQQSGQHYENGMHGVVTVERA